ncbi:MAG TPA: hypothetical protein DEV81_14805 [Cyanobacteria bacterium UBA11049]|nr:hypothetical protein [Cyanobacteria bacterium UBA11049]
MARGGKRERAGRPTSWTSGVKFEETVLIRVPRLLKEKLLEIAHRLDAGESVDLVSSSDNKELEELKSKVLLADLEKSQLTKELEKYHLDLETKLTEFQLQAQELKQENYKLQNLVNKNQSTSDVDLNSFLNLLSQFIQTRQKQIQGLRPIEIAGKTHKMLSDLEKIVNEIKLSFNIVTNSEIGEDSVALEIVTKSNLPENEIVTKLLVPDQLELLDIKTNDNLEKFQPLTSTELSRRFNKPDGFVKSKKYQLKNKPSDFLRLLKETDPQGIGWQYSEEDKKYHPILQKQDEITES